MTIMSRRQVVLQKHPEQQSDNYVYFEAAAGVTPCEEHAGGECEQEGGGGLGGGGGGADDDAAVAVIDGVGDGEQFGAGVVEFEPAEDVAEGGTQDIALAGAHAEVEIAERNCHCGPRIVRGEDD